MKRLQDVDLHFLPSEIESQIPEDYSYFLQRNENRIEEATAK